LNLQAKKFNLLKSYLTKYYLNISSDMKTSLTTLLEFLPLIKNTFNTDYHNGFIEKNNNLSKF